MKSVQYEKSTYKNFRNFPDFLIERGVVTPRQAQHIHKLATQWGSDFAKACLATDLKSPAEFSQLVAEFFNLPHRDLSLKGPDLTLLDPTEKRTYLKLEALPIEQMQGITVITCAHPTDDVLAWAKERYGSRFALCISSVSQIHSAVDQSFALDWSHEACEALNESNARDSAKKTLNTSQKIFFMVSVLSLISSLAFAYHFTLTLICILINIYYLFTLCFRLMLTVYGNDPIAETEVTNEEVEKLIHANLPRYTVLVPIYKETAILPHLIQHLREIKYPRSKLEIKIILETDDHETLAALHALRLENFFECLIVPPANPKTKPKALNYALPFVTGEFLTIYDAEDRPEPDQLLKALVVFQRMKEVSCVQARLNYFNREENYLTRMFTIEYSQWFDYFLLGLYRLGIPVPLGGTSNHFRTAVLKELGGWDPYNVTEDADLGVRFEKNGHRVAIVNSTTWEEANTEVGNWIRQRSRWLKGHMQTFLVHTRRPFELYQQIGGVGFFGFCFFIGAPFFVAILNPIFWFLVTWTAFLQEASASDYFPVYLQKLFAVNLIVGNICFILMGAYALRKRGFWRLLPWAIHLPIYWLLQSIAAYKALWQLIVAPHFWEKTKHGLSNQLRGGNHP